jgi:hypothetical protein
MKPAAKQGQQLASKDETAFKAAVVSSKQKIFFFFFVLFGFSRAE